MNPPVPDDVSAHRELVFKSVGDQKLELDLLPNNTTEPVPAIVMVHGGCWMAGARTDMNFYAVELAKLGYATAAVDYRLSQDAPYPAAVED